MSFHNFLWQSRGQTEFNFLFAPTKISLAKSLTSISLALQREKKLWNQPHSFCRLITETAGTYLQLPLRQRGAGNV